MIACARMDGYIDPAYITLNKMNCLHRSLILFLIEILLSGSVQAQHSDGDSPFSFIPGRVTFPPLTANYQEPRVGLRKEISTSRMKLDIGSTFDILEYSFSDDRTTNLRMGVDFFTYALTTNSQGLRLQVDAVDGFFGGHITYQDQKPRGTVSIRLRLLHVSAHFLDGHFDNTTGLWKDGRAPIPYTRDFGECVGAYAWREGSLAFMLYSGISYATLIRPVEIRRIATIHGIEARTESIGDAFGKPCNLYAADNLTFVGVPKYTGTNNLEFGVKLGEWGDRGVKLYASYYSGLEAFSQYYNVRSSQWGLGFSFDVW